jgi:hypothetical protein
LQPKYEGLVRIGRGRFGLLTRLPSGVPVTVPLAGSAKLIDDPKD